MSDASFSSTAYNPDRLIAGGDVKTQPVTLTDISSTGALVRGTVLGMQTSGEAYGICLNASADGSQVARAILVEDADPSGGDVAATVYVLGDFNQDRLIFGTGTTAANSKEDLRAVGIILKDPVSA